MFLSALAALAVAACDARPVGDGSSSRPSSSAALTTCTGCHGDLAHGNAAPPLGVSGATDTSDPAVGAHQSHLVAGHFRGPVPCQDCHVVPATVSEPGHMGSAIADVRFDAPGSSGVAAARGASPSVQFGAIDPADPKRRPDATCTVYCHGATLDGGTRSRPSWAGAFQAGSTTLDCSSCHGFPPGGKHPQNFERTPDAPARACARCHSRTVAADGTLDLAGGNHINGVVDFAGGDACSACHGDPSRQGVAGSDPLVAASPPQTVTGAAPGAHLAHVNGDGTPLRTPLACTECHAHVAEETAATHPDGKVDVDFGPLASASALAPSWDAATGSCAATYCHGVTLPGGTHTTPVWTGGSQEARCGACHGIPPPAPHVQTTDCGRCHGGYSAASVNLATHVDGKLDVIALTCSSCHGSVANPAPPTGTHGETDTTSLAVGAHQSHLAGGALSSPVACTECHVVPTSTSHATGTVAISFGALATTQGAKPAFDATTGTCAGTYCHGSFTGGKVANLPVWNKVDGSQDACGSCHAIPPAAPHPQNTSCGSCHGAGYSATTVNAATHVNGVVDVGGLTCTSCHGSSSRVPVGGADPDVRAAPPVDSHGNSDPSARGVGAHAAHVNQTTWRGAPLACSDCHFNAVPTTTTHATGTVQFAFGPLARNATWGGVAPAAVWNGTTCASTYCHGAFKNGAATTMTWTQPGGAGCGSCHGIPPAGGHPQNANCGSCHDGYTSASVNPSLHINGALDVKAMSCTSCHGDATRTPPAGADANFQAAPPVDTAGLVASAAVGAHQSHLAGGALAVPLACNSCHQVPASTLNHPTGTLNTTFGGLAVTGGAAPQLDASTLACSSTYCHGAFPGGNAFNAPIWNGASQATCGSCHTIPPPAPHVQNSSCGNCHGSGYSSSTVNAATHVNGVVDVGSMTCTSCHGDPSRTVAAGLDPKLKAAPPVDTAGNTSSVAVGAHQAHLTRTDITTPLACTECHPDVTSIPHSNGTVDVTFGARAAAGGAVPVFTSATATCSSTYCHGNYSGTFNYTFGVDGLDNPIPVSFAYGQTGGSPVWSGAPMTCGSCHAMPPNNATWHSGSHGYDATYNTCQLCHPDASGQIASGGVVTSAAITDPSKHVNGNVDAGGNFTTKCFGCH